MPNYVQLKLVRREMVTSPVTCVSVAYLFHRDFISSPVKDMSAETHKKDTISTSVELHGLDESRSLLVVTGHQNKQLVSWIFDYELNEEIDLKQLSENKEKETTTTTTTTTPTKVSNNPTKSATPETTTKTKRLSLTSRPPVPGIFEKKHKISYEENLRPKKVVIGKSESEITSLQLGNILMSTWLAETSIALPTNNTAIKRHEMLKDDKEREKTKKLMGEVERYKKNLLKKILYRHYVFVGTLDSKVGMYTMNIKAKANDRCLYLYRFRPKSVSPGQINYIWKGEEEGIKEQTQSLVKFESKQPLSIMEQEKKYIKEKKKEVLEESNFITLNTLAKSESEADYVSSSKQTASKLSTLHHFQQLAEPDYTSSAIPSTTTSQLERRNTGALTTYSKEMRGGTSSSRTCTVDPCVVT